MAFRVIITRGGLRDLEDIGDYIAVHDSLEKAAHVITRIESAIKSLSDQPYRGNIPKELLHLGAREWREVFFKPYRIIYRVKQKVVYVHLIADGRRDMQTLLQRRLFGV